MNGTMSVVEAFWIAITCIAVGVHAIGSIDAHQAIKIIRERGLNEGRDLVASLHRAGELVSIYVQAVFALAGFSAANLAQETQERGVVDYLVAGLFISAAVALLGFSMYARARRQRLLGITMARRATTSDSPLEDERPAHAAM